MTMKFTPYLDQEEWTDSDNPQLWFTCDLVSECEPTLDAYHVMKGHILGYTNNLAVQELLIIKGVLLMDECADTETDLSFFSVSFSDEIDYIFFIERLNQFLVECDEGKHNLTSIVPSRWP